MCGHVSTVIAADTCPCVVGYSEDAVIPPPPPPPQEQFPPLQLLLNHHELMIAAEFDISDEHPAIFNFYGGSGDGYGGGSSRCNSLSSLLSGGGGGGELGVMQRSVSSNDGFLSHFASTHGPTLETGPVRRALSAGDLHRMRKKGEQQGRRGESELWSESNAIIQGMNRTVKYSPHEKKQRIERYKSKRFLRNFNKRIKYECRKTLADSRPRIRGRFARNDETEDNNHNNNQMSQLYVQDLDTTWSSFLDSLSVNHFLNL